MRKTGMMGSGSMLAALAPALALVIGLSACATVAKVDRPGPSTPVLATLETPSVGTAGEDAADDPAIWASARPVTFKGRMIDGFVAGTDKKAGLYIYGLDGQVLQFLPEGLLNNVDVIEGLSVNGRPQVLLGASDRTPGQMGISLFLYDPASTAADNGVRRWGLAASDVAEPYGFCVGRREGQIHAVLVAKDGGVRQYVISADAAGAPVSREVRRFNIGSISEGCVVDEDSGALYINEENVGVWRYDLNPASGAARVQVAPVDNKRLTADAEGAAILKDGDKRYLIVSSQGDSTFPVWRIDGAEPVYAGRFSVQDGPKVSGVAVDGVTGTDGIDALGGRVGERFPEGLVVVQDDVNDAGTQNFKYIDWRDIRTALGL